MAEFDPFEEELLRELALAQGTPTPIQAPAPSPTLQEPQVDPFEQELLRELSDTTEPPRPVQGLAGGDTQPSLTFTPPKSPPAVPSIRQPIEPTLAQRITRPIERFFAPDREKSANILSLSKITGQSITQVEKNYNQITFDLGLRGATLGEIAEAGVTAAAIPAIGAGILSNPVTTITMIGSFLATKAVAERTVLPLAKAAYQKLTSKPVQFEVTQLRDLAPDAFKTSADLAEFILYGTIAGKAIASAKFISPRIMGKLNGLRFKIGKMMGKKFETSLVPAEPLVPAKPQPRLNVPPEQAQKNFLTNQSNLMKAAGLDSGILKDISPVKLQKIGDIVRLNKPQHEKAKLIQKLFPKEKLRLRQVQSEVTPEPFQPVGKTIQETTVIPGTGVPKSAVIDEAASRPLGRLAEVEQQINGGVDAFLKRPRKRIGILKRFFTPTDRELEVAGMGEVGKVTRDALRNKLIEITAKQKFLVEADTQLRGDLKRRGLTSEKDVKAAWENVRNLMEKGGIPKNPKTPAERIAKAFRVETEEMLTRMNKIRRESGQKEVTGIKEYLLHAVKDEILREIQQNVYQGKQGLSLELSDVFKFIPSKKAFLKTALERNQIPDEWLVRDPRKLMDLMYKIDLKYIHLQDALTRIEPYTQYLEGRKAVPKGQEGFDRTVYNYWTNFVDHSIKNKPSQIDENLNATFDALIGLALNKLPKVRGKLNISHAPYQQVMHFVSSAMYAGALGARIKPVLRNMVQSSFDWVMFGTEAYAKGSGKFMTKEGHNILKQSKIWRTRVPHEMMEFSNTNKLYNTLSIPYKASDMHNVGKGLLTRYYHAKDTLKMNHHKSLEFADNDLPNTQWSYLREDMPSVFQTTTGRSINALGSWWMNFYFRFMPELMTRTFKGVDISGRKIPKIERRAGMRFLGLVGMLHGLSNVSETLTGTAIDYTAQVHPKPFGMSPISQFLGETAKLVQAMAGADETKVKQAVVQLAKQLKIFIPAGLSISEIIDVSKGKKPPSNIFFYTKTPFKLGDIANNPLDRKRGGAFKSLGPLKLGNNGPL